MSVADAHVSFNGNLHVPVERCLITISQRCQSVQGLFVDDFKSTPDFWDALASNDTLEMFSITKVRDDDRITRIDAFVRRNKLLKDAIHRTKCEIDRENQLMPFLAELTQEDNDIEKLSGIYHVVRNALVLEISNASANGTAVQEDGLWWQRRDDLVPRQV